MWTHWYAQQRIYLDAYKNKMLLLLQLGSKRRKEILDEGSMTGVHVVKGNGRTNRKGKKHWPNGGDVQR